MARNDATFQVPLPQMLDLALGTPEVGSVNFNILHNFLHILLHQTSLNNVKAEYQGSDAARIKDMVGSLKDGSNFYLHESNIIDMDGNIVQRDYVPDNTIVTANFSTIDDQISQKNDEVEDDIVDSFKQADDTDNDEEFIEREEFRDFINTSQSTVHGSQQEQTLKETSGKTEGNKKEQKGGIKPSTHSSKISGLTATSKTALSLDGLKEEVACLKSDVARIMQDVAQIRYDVNELVVDKEELAEKRAEMEDVMVDISDASEIKPMEPAEKRLSQEKKVFSLEPPSSDILQTADETETFIDEVDELDALNVESLPSLEIPAEDQSECSDSRKSSKSSVSTATTLSKPEKNLTNDEEILKDLKDGKKSCIALIEVLQNKYEDFRKIDSRVKALENMSNFDGFEGIEEIKDVIQNVKNIEIDIERMNWTIENLNKERATHDKNMDILTEQVELLKIMKADREDLENALASKADATVVNRKVSHSRFDTAYEELNSALEDTILKSNQQETILKETLDTVQQEMENKLDKTEVSPVQEYMEEKLEALQNKLKELTRKKREYEAAGAKKILTGLQCITCDKNVIMKREKALDYPDLMPYRKNIKPYLTYKLDQARKHQRQFPAKHMNLFTSAVQEMNRHKFSTDMIEKSSKEDHFSNRYCGGSHTITTPQQRVMRMGHFLTDWGPEIIQLNEETVQGIDGQLYHGRPMPPGITNVPKVCGLDENVCCNHVKKAKNFKC